MDLTFESQRTLKRILEIIDLSKLKKNDLAIFLSFATTIGSSGSGGCCPLEETQETR